ncbi:hypothetical protein KP509_11G068100 [Ceratopteris richardii]|uniref:Pectinesterase inhibitor domain-containing protein n=1 Tax=Ceratopteris richardii TaxID=49495 RepID=A0A8T2TWA6_CERRI|nr:hypothetical protein KP509_11G068100 [Ceratopteris richardii]
MSTVRLLLQWVCVILVLGCVASAPSRRHDRLLSSRQNGTSSTSFTEVCRKTHDPQMCSRVLAASSAPPSGSLNAKISAVASFALSLTHSSYRLARHLVTIPLPQSAPLKYLGALDDCMELMNDTVHELKLSISRLSGLGNMSGPSNITQSQLMDAQVALSASCTYQDTCSDELNDKGMPSAATAQLRKQVINTSNAVAVALDLPNTLRQRIAS